MSYLSNGIGEKLRSAFLSNSLEIEIRNDYLIVLNSKNKEIEKIKAIAESTGFRPLVSQNRINGDFVLTISPYAIPEFFKMDTLSASQIVQKQVEDQEANLRQAIKSGNIEFIEGFIFNSVSLNKVDVSGTSLLGYALSKRQMLIAKLLISKGATLSKAEIKNTDSFWRLLLGKECHAFYNQNCRKNSPVKISTDLQQNFEYVFLLEELLPLLPKKFRKLIEMEGILLSQLFSSEKAMDLFLQKLSLAEQTFWIRAASSHLNFKLEFMDYLIKKGASSADFLCSAVLYNRKDIIEYLLQKGTDINGFSDKGETALNMACDQNHVHLVEFLLENGADPNLVGKSGKTPALVASKECLSIIKENGQVLLTDYLFQLLLVTHLFQIEHRAEEPALRQAVLTGFHANMKNLLPAYNYIDSIFSDLQKFVSEKNTQKEFGSSIAQLSSLAYKSADELASEYQKGKGILISSGWLTELSGHATFMWAEGNLLLHCNSSLHPDGSSAIKVYYLSETSKLTGEVIQKIRGHNRDYIENGLLKNLNLELLGICKSKGQRGNFCSVRSLLLVIKGIIALKNLKPGIDKDKLFEAILNSEKETSTNYNELRNFLMDHELKKMLDLYESKGFLYKPEISLLLMILSKLPENSSQALRLISFLEKSQCDVKMNSNGKNFMHHLKGTQNLEWIMKLFGEQSVKEALPSLINQHNDENRIYQPLLLALIENRPQSAQLLLQLGANPLLPTERFISPLEYVLQTENIDFFKSIMKSVKKENMDSFIQNTLKMCHDLQKIELRKKIIGLIDESECH